EGQTLAQLIASRKYPVRQRDDQAGGNTTTDVPLSSGANVPGTSGEPSAPAAAEKPATDAAYCRRVAEWVIEAAQALEHAHTLGIVHRDIKPGNLILDWQGNLWVTDFGLALFPSDSGLTMTGDVVGTLRYMSPEQALAKRCVVDHRTDIYALGATLYELLT